MPQSHQSDTDALTKVAISRRSFLRFSAIGTTAVVSTGVVGSLTACSSQPSAAKALLFYVMVI